MYLAGLIADEAKMTKKDLSLWVSQAKSTNISDYTVPWIAAESQHGYELALEWIDSKTQHIAAAGWSTLSSLVSIKPDTDLNIPALKKLLYTCRNNHTPGARPNSLKMNGFVIALGSFVPALTADALATAKKMGVITIIKEGTACKTPDATTLHQQSKNQRLPREKEKNGALLNLF